ncbi:hypothetical protein O181_027382 [Austropuccinia psidii MF-1]|uniref:Aquaporin n=1 Tax=Austropuccinia psidii MF-1 TaxID=1389203 RepID=A0A9Q3CSI7_9BASI|nr:hypothetical protein [Austropuccinia psidii MF-1]
MESKSTWETFILQLKRDALAATAEFFGTALFLLIGMGGIQAAAASTQAAQDNLKAVSPNAPVNAVASVEHLLYVSTSMALALLASAWTFFRVSGSAFNPQIALALLLTGAMPPMRFVLYVAAQLSASIVASALLSAILPGTLAVGCKLGVGTTYWQGVWIEAFLTSALTLTVLFLAVEKHRSTPFAPVAIGLVLFATHLLGVIYTGAAMNSARAFGPDVITGFPSYHWIYWVGPTIGSIFGTLFYLFMKSVDYGSLNPKQDSDNNDDSPDVQGIEVKMRRRPTTLQACGPHQGNRASDMQPSYGMGSKQVNYVYQSNEIDPHQRKNSDIYECDGQLVSRRQLHPVHVGMTVPQCYMSPITTNAGGRAVLMRSQSPWGHEMRNGDRPHKEVPDSGSVTHPRDEEAGPHPDNFSNSAHKYS